MTTPTTASVEFEHAAQHMNVITDELNICGCGNPEDAYVLVRGLLGLMPLFEDDHLSRATELIGTSGAIHLVLGSLESADLITHGGTVMGSWLTEKGTYALAAMQVVSWDDLREAGYPHSLERHIDDCTDACWVLQA